MSKPAINIDEIYLASAHDVVVSSSEHLQNLKEQIGMSRELIDQSRRVINSSLDILQSSSLAPASGK
jgi:hypothetical protein